MFAEELFPPLESTATGTGCSGAFDATGMTVVTGKSMDQPGVDEPGDQSTGNSMNDGSADDRADSDDEDDAWLFASSVTESKEVLMQDESTIEDDKAPTLTSADIINSVIQNTLASSELALGDDGDDPFAASAPSTGNVTPAAAIKGAETTTNTTVGSSAKSTVNSFADIASERVQRAAEPTSTDVNQMLHREHSVESKSKKQHRLSDEQSKSRARSATADEDYEDELSSRKVSARETERKILEERRKLRSETQRLLREAPLPIVNKPILVDESHDTANPHLSLLSGVFDKLRAVEKELTGGAKKPSAMSAKETELAVGLQALRKNIEAKRQQELAAAEAKRSRIVHKGVEIATKLHEGRVAVTERVVDDKELVFDIEEEDDDEDEDQDQDAEEAEDEAETGPSEEYTLVDILAAEEGIAVEGNAVVEISPRAEDDEEEEEDDVDEEVDEEEAQMELDDEEEEEEVIDDDDNGEIEAEEEEEEDVEESFIAADDDDEEEEENAKVQNSAAAAIGGEGTKSSPSDNTSGSSVFSRMMAAAAGKKKSSTITDFPVIGTLPTSGPSASTQGASAPSVTDAGRAHSPSPSPTFQATQLLSQAEDDKSQPDSQQDEVDPATQPNGGRFIDMEADESDGEGDDEDVDESILTPEQLRRRQQRKHRAVTEDDEEENDDDAAAAAELKDFVCDESESSEEASDDADNGQLREETLAKEDDELEMLKERFVAPHSRDRPPITRGTSKIGASESSVSPAATFSSFVDPETSSAVRAMERARGERLAGWQRKLLALDEASRLGSHHTQSSNGGRYYDEDEETAEVEQARKKRMKEKHSRRKHSGDSSDSGLDSDFDVEEVDKVDDEDIDIVNFTGCPDPLEDPDGHADYMRRVKKKQARLRKQELALHMKLGLTRSNQSSGSFSSFSGSQLPATLTRAPSFGLQLSTSPASSFSSSNRRPSSVTPGGSLGGGSKSAESVTPTSGGFVDFTSVPDLDATLPSHFTTSSSLTTVTQTTTTKVAITRIRRVNSFTKIDNLSGDNTHGRRDSIAALERAPSLASNPFVTSASSHAENTSGGAKPEASFDLVLGNSDSAVATIARAPNTVALASTKHSTLQRLRSHVLEDLSSMANSVLGGLSSGPATSPTGGTTSGTTTAPAPDAGAPLNISSKLKRTVVLTRDLTRDASKLGSTDALGSITGPVSFDSFGDLLAPGKRNEMASPHSNSVSQTQKRRKSAAAQDDQTATQKQSGIKVLDALKKGMQR